jgi:hypothetical protein
MEQVGFDAARLAGADGADGRCDDQNAAGAQAFLYAESAAQSKLAPRAGAEIRETFGAAPAQGFRRAVSEVSDSQNKMALLAHFHNRPRPADSQQPMLNPAQIAQSGPAK